MGRTVDPQFWLLAAVVFEFAVRAWPYVLTTLSIAAIGFALLCLGIITNRVAALADAAESIRGHLYDIKYLYEKENKRRD